MTGDSVGAAELIDVDWSLTARVYEVVENRLLIELEFNGGTPLQRLCNVAAAEHGPRLAAGTGFINR